MSLKSVGKFPNIRKENIDKNLLSSFNIKDDLNRDMWDNNDQLKPNIRKNLLLVGKDFFDYLELNTEIKDILLTGSLSNFNWSKYSDIDLHVVFDFNSVKQSDDPEFIKEYVNSKRGLWNDTHTIKIKGFDVELYPQDLNEPHKSTGVYSVLKNEWIRKPERKQFKIDYQQVKNKAEQIMKEIDSLCKELNKENIKEEIEGNETIKQIKKKGKVEDWFVLNILDQVEKKSFQFYPGDIFWVYKNSNKISMSYEKIFNRLNIDNNIWDVFKDNYSKDDKEIKELIKFIAEEYLNLEDVKPIKLYSTESWKKINLTEQQNNKIQYIKWSDFKKNDLYYDNLIKAYFKYESKEDEELYGISDINQFNMPGGKYFCTTLNCIEHYRENIGYIGEKNFELKDDTIIAISDDETIIYDPKIKKEIINNADGVYSPAYDTYGIVIWNKDKII